MTKDPRQPQEEPEELAHYDDAIIGRALRGSLIAIVILAGIGVGVFLYLRRKPPAAPAQVTTLQAPVSPARPAAQIPRAPFTAVTSEAGIRFVHTNGAYGDKLLPETMGGGVAFLDIDNDRDQDLLFVNSSEWPWRASDGKTATPPALYRNDGKGRFEESTAGSGLGRSFYGMGIAAGDYDNDGNIDLFFTAVGGNHLYRNLGGGRFEEVTSPAGVGGTTNGWSTCAAWMDFDRDGDLDLFVGNYVRWSREIDFEVGYKLVGVGRAYGQPMNFEGAFPYLYRNDGGGRFTDVTAGSGLQVRNPSTGVPAAKSLGVAPVDLDSDGWIDLVVANDTVPNFVFLNQRDGTFREIGAASGIAFDSYGNTRGAMGIDTARHRNDASLGIAIGNFANEMTALYVSQHSPTNFADEAITEGIGPDSRLLLKFGIFFFDYDLDGWLDLLSCNGHLEEEIHKIQKSQQYAQPAQLFWNAGGGGHPGFLTVMAEQAGRDLYQPIVGRGSAFADMDDDGDLDVVLTQTGGPPLLLRNDQTLGHHWVRLKLVGTRSNRDAIGAWVTLKAGGVTRHQQVMPTRSYLSQSELPVTFGLAKIDKIDAITVVWPDGSKQEIGSVPIDTLTVIEQPR